VNPREGRVQSPLLCEGGRVEPFGLYCRDDVLRASTGPLDDRLAVEIDGRDLKWRSSRNRSPVVLGRERRPIGIDFDDHYFRVAADQPWLVVSL
jgi:hypothetical protein